jgi:hypothetical protein
MIELAVPTSVEWFLFYEEIGGGDLATAGFL